LHLNVESVFENYYNYENYNRTIITDMVSLCAHNTSALTHSLNMGTGEVSIIKWEKTSTFFKEVTYVTLF